MKVKIIFVYPLCILIKILTVNVCICIALSGQKNVCAGIL